MTEANATIILMDDDATFRGLLADGLRDANYKVVEAATGPQAKDAVESVQGAAILVADRALDKDGPNGFALAAAALEQYPTLRVIYISGTHIAIRHRTLGPRERGLLKPFAMSQLLLMVRELGG